MFIECTDQCKMGVDCSNRRFETLDENTTVEVTGVILVSSSFLDADMGFQLQRISSRRALLSSIVEKSYPR